MPTEPDAAAFNVIERSSHYFLSQDDEGFALWSVKGDDAGPVLTFPPGDDGEALARSAFKRESRFGAWAGFLLVAGFISAGIWFVSELLAQGLITLTDRASLSPFGLGERPMVEVVRMWAYAVSSLANTVFIIAIGLSLVIWLHRRYRREG